MGNSADHWKKEQDLMAGKITADEYNAWWNDTHKNPSKTEVAQPAATTNPGSGTNFHQAAIDAAKNGDWAGVSEALNNREKKVMSTGENFGKSSTDILNELYAKYGQTGQDAQLGMLQGIFNDLFGRKYSDPYDTSAVLNQLMGMNYEDWTKGEAYKGLQKRYQDRGQEAMQDVLGQVAARTGGLASSYATTAAQQEYDEYMRQLEEVARQMYASERGELMDDYSLLAKANADSYNRWQQNWNNDYSMYQSGMDQWNANRNFDYQKGQDAIKNQYTKAGYTGYLNGDRTLQGQIFDHNVDQDAFNNGLATADRTGYMPDGTMTWDAQMDTWDKDQAKNDSLLAIAETAAKGGDTSILKKLFPDLTDEQLAAIATALSPTTKSRGGGGGGGELDYEGLFEAAKASGNPKSWLAQKANYSKYGFTSSSGLFDDYEAWLEGAEQDEIGDAEAHTYLPTFTTLPTAPAYTIGDAPDLNWTSVNNLNIGPVSAQTLETLLNAGGIYEDGKGNVYWSEGWNEDNYRAKLGI